MQGDALARGARSATFHKNMAPAAPKSRNAVDVEAPREIFCECRDCDGVFYSAKEFCDHIEDGKCVEPKAA